ncbi:MAG: DUF1501 domain-containing protein [Planctomycetota bacterium]
MARIHRRDFLKLGSAGLALGVLGPLLRPAALSQLLHASNAIPGRRLLVIFLRGGNDGVNTLIPHGDSSYNPTERPTLYIPPAASLDLGNGFAALNPALGPLHQLYQLGDVACIHRVGYPDQSRSHFSSQQFWENGKPLDEDLVEGWLYRYVTDAYDLASQPLVAASISDQLMLVLKGELQLAHFPTLASFDLTVPGSPDGQKILGELPNPSAAQAGSGLLGWYGQPASTHGYDGLIKSSGQSLGAALNSLAGSGVDPAAYVPANGAVYPSAANPLGFPDASFPFFSRVRDAAMLFKLSDLRVAGIELEGWDTHVNQAGAQGALLSYVAHAIRALSLDLQSIWNDVVVLTLSEFGRTSQENGSAGTDHGEASALFVAGGAVQGGVYNCDSTTWSNGDLFSTPNGRYVERRTDFRAVLGEVLVRHLGLPAPSLDFVFPGYAGHAGDPTFSFLNFLP